MRPYSTRGVARAISDPRVTKITFSYSGGIVTVWDSVFHDKAAPDYRALGIRGARYELDVHLADGRSMGMMTYLEEEAPKPKKARRPYVAPVIEQI